MVVYNIYMFLMASSCKTSRQLCSRAFTSSYEWVSKIQSDVDSLPHFSFRSESLKLKYIPITLLEEGFTRILKCIQKGFHSTVFLRLLTERMLLVI